MRMLMRRGRRAGMDMLEHVVPGWFGTRFQYSSIIYAFNVTVARGRGSCIEDCAAILETWESRVVAVSSRFLLPLAV
jgi:hypothetical protein